jgi:hypothetical protein
MDACVAQAAAVSLGPIELNGMPDFVKLNLSEAAHPAGALIGAIEKTLLGTYRRTARCRYRSYAHAAQAR